MKKIILFTLGLLLATFAYSTEVSFQILQFDATQDDVCEQTLLIEDQILEFFFDKGDIVTNEPSMVATKKNADSLQKSALLFAENGGAKYFVCVQLNYAPDSKAKNIVQLSNLKSVTWTAINVSTKKKVASGTKKVKVAPNSVNNADSVKSFAQDIASQIQAIAFSK